jgi:hypothetical protein
VESAPMGGSRPWTRSGSGVTRVARADPHLMPTAVDSWTPMHDPEPFMPSSVGASSTQGSAVRRTGASAAQAAGKQHVQPQLGKPWPTTSTSQESSVTLMRSASSLSYARFSYYGGRLSPMQQLEADELSRHMAQRAESLARMHNKRYVEQQRAVARKEPFPTQRRRAKRSAEIVKRVCAEALAQPITYLPAMPAAANLARRSWARDDLQTEAERDEAKSLVEELSDDLGTLNTVISAWVRPDMQKQWLTSLKGRASEGKGMAPQSRHFRAISSKPGIGDRGPMLQPYEQPRSSP